METTLIKEPPDIRWLFLFFSLSIVHLILLLFIYYDIKYILLVIIELLFFIHDHKKAIKILVKILIISSVIFLINLFFTEGKIILNYGIIKITSEGLENSIKRGGVLILLFLFTLNSFKDRKDKILQYYMLNIKKGLIVNSINYFLIFWNLLGEKESVKRSFVKIINVYKNKCTAPNHISSNKKMIGYDFYIYQVAFFSFFIIVSFLL